MLSASLNKTFPSFLPLHFLNSKSSAVQLCIFSLWPDWGRVQVVKRQERAPAPQKRPAVLSVCARVSARPTGASWCTQTRRRPRETGAAFLGRTSPDGFRPWRVSLHTSQRYHRGRGWSRGEWSAPGNTPGVVRIIPDATRKWMFLSHGGS